MNTSTPLLVAYDIADHRRRCRLHRLLLGFGEPVQKSVFVCRLDRSRRERLDRVLADFRGGSPESGERIDCLILREPVAAGDTGVRVVE